jgi:hypothetical protein
LKNPDAEIKKMAEELVNGMNHTVHTNELVNR